MSIELLAQALTNAMPRAEWLVWLRALAKDDLTTARRVALLRLVWQESYLSYKGLKFRIEDLIGRGCFGATPRMTFAQDILVVRETLKTMGHRLTYCKHEKRWGYWVVGRPLLDEYLQKLIAGAMAEVDPRQIAIYKRLTPTQRVWQCIQLSDWLWQANQQRLRRKALKG